MIKSLFSNWYLWASAMLTLLGSSTYIWHLDEQQRLKALTITCNALADSLANLEKNEKELDRRFSVHEVDLDNIVTATKIALQQHQAAREAFNRDVNRSIDMMQDLSKGYGSMPKWNQDPPKPQGKGQ